MAVDQRRARAKARKVREVRSRLDKLLDQRDSTIEKIRSVRAELKTATQAK